MDANAEILGTSAAQVEEQATRLDEAVREHTAALREQYALYEGLIQAQSDLGEGVIIADAVARRYLYVNDAMETITGYSREELMALPSVLALVPPEEQAVLVERQRRRIAGEPTPSHYETVILSKSGARVDVEISIKPLGGDQAKVISIIRDITARKQTEQALIASAERFRHFAENASDLIFRVRLLPSYAVEYVSPSITRILGYTVEEFAADPQLADKLLDPEDRTQRDAGQQALLQGQISDQPTTLRYRHKDGRLVWLEYRVVPIYDEEGRLAGIEGIGRDVTERVQAQHSLEERVEERTREIDRRRAVAEGLGEIIATLNSNRPLGEVLGAIAAQAEHLLNAGAVAIYALNADNQELTIQAARGLSAADIRDARVVVGQGAVGRAVAERKPIPIPDVALLLQDDELSDVDPQTRLFYRGLVDRYRAALSVPVKVRDAMYGGISLYYTDVRPFSDEDIALAVAFADQAALALENARLRVEAEEAAALQERSRLARELHDAVSQTLFSATIIADVLPRLWEQNETEARKRLAELRELNSGALAEMRSLLLELRPQTLGEMPLGDLLRQLADTARQRARIPIHLQVEADGTLPPQVQLALYRIAQEALNNIIRHARAAHVTIDLRGKPDRVELTIADDGRGFDPQGVPPGHLGIGIMRERAEAIGAVLALESAPERGTRVSLIWEATPEQSQAAAPVP
jgi:PAS domain S-box-containing protein